MMTREDVKMCDVCNSLGQDYKFLSGENRSLRDVHLYQIVAGKVVIIKLCYVHDIELFKVGERRFLDIFPSIIPLINQRAS